LPDVIAKLRGVVDSVGEGRAVVDVGGVGYLLNCSERTLGRLPAAGEAVELLVETQMREDQINLYGFVEAAEREWFRILQSVQGVGSRSALAVLSILPPAQLARAIAAQDRAAIARATGVGPRLAGRIVSELRERVSKMPVAAEVALTAATVPSGAAEDAVSALANLGYRRAEALGAVARALQELGPEASVDALIRAGLAELAAKRA
jgi:holliday junction DNA helicase RuvA